MPVIGLGALFCILSAVVAPIIEVGRIARGRSSVASWLRVGRQFGLAVAMLAALAVTLHLVYALVAGIGFPELSPGDALVMPSVLIGTSVALLAAILTAAKGLQLAVHTRPGHLPPLALRTRTVPGRLFLQGAGVLVAVWFPLLGFGAAGLSTRSEGVVSRGPIPAVERAAGADVAGVVSPLERVFDSRRHEQVGEAGVVPTADANDASLPPPTSSEGQLVEQTPQNQAAPAGDTTENGGIPRTDGPTVSNDTGGSAQVTTTGGVAAPASPIGGEN
jgi:hypothetical protein